MDEIVVFEVNNTLRENVTFGEKFRQSRYDAVVEACGLKQDLAAFEGGDQIMIGERGINLSGGNRPYCLCCQRTNASQPIIFCVLKSYLG